MRRATRYRHGVGNQKALAGYRAGRNRQPLALTIGDVVRIGQADPSLALRDNFHDHRIAIDQERFVGRESTAPALPSVIAPMLAQRVEMRRCRTKLRIRQRHSAAPGFIRKLFQRFWG